MNAAYIQMPSKFWQVHQFKSHLEFAMHNVQSLYKILEIIRRKILKQIMKNENCKKNINVQEAKLIVFHML